MLMVYGRGGWSQASEPGKITHRGVTTLLISIICICFEKNIYVGFWPSYNVLQRIKCDRPRTHKKKTENVQSCYTRRFATTIFSATQRCIIVATLFRIAATLFHYCNALLR